MTLNLPLLYGLWLEEYCQISPNKNKSPNLWHVTSILVCCIFEYVVIELADKLYNSVTVCFCLSPWIFIQINFFFSKLPGIEPLTLGLQSQRSTHTSTYSTRLHQFCYLTCLSLLFSCLVLFMYPQRWTSMLYNQSAYKDYRKIKFNLINSKNLRWQRQGLFFLQQVVIKVGCMVLHLAW